MRDRQNQWSSIIRWLRLAQRISVLQAGRLSEVVHPSRTIDPTYKDDLSCCATLRVFGIRVIMPALCYGMCVSCLTNGSRHQGDQLASLAMVPSDCRGLLRTLEGIFSSLTISVSLGPLPRSKSVGPKSLGIHRFRGRLSLLPDFHDCRVNGFRRPPDFQALELSQVRSRCSVCDFGDPSGAPTTPRTGRPKFQARQHLPHGIMAVTPYRPLKPETVDAGQKKYPLVLVLHGWGERGDLQ